MSQAMKGWKMLLLRTRARRSMVREEEGVDMIDGGGGCDGGDWEKGSVLETVVDGRVYMRCVRGVVMS